MGQNRSKKNDHSEVGDNRFGLLLLLLAILIAGWAVLFAPSKSPSKPESQREKTGAEELSSRSALPPDVLEQKIEEHLKDTAQKEALRRRTVETENSAVNGVGVDEVLTGADKVNVLRLDQERAAEAIANKLEAQSRGGVGRATSPEERVNRQVEADQWTEEYRRRYEKEYVRQFIENAKKNGVDVKLNDNLDVVGISEHPVEGPIRVPQSEDSEKQTAPNSSGMK